MIARLVVPLDGSPEAERAIGLADTMAEVADLPVELFASRWDLGTAPAEVYLRQQGQTMRHADVKVQVALDDSAAVAIAQELGTLPDSLAVMTSHGRSGLGQALLGSVTERVLHLSPAPVLVIGSRWSGLALTKGSSILVAIDGALSADSLFGPVTDLARMFGLHIWVVQVLPVHRPKGLESSQESTAVHQMAATLSDAGTFVDWEVLHGPDVADSLVDFAATHGISVMALATRAREGIKRVTLGSVAMRTVRNARQPVLLTRTELTEH